MTLQLTGECNQCGRCCMSRDGKAICENLVLLDLAIGQPNTTQCEVWETRYHGMPIRMLNWDGTLAYESRCTVLAQYLAEHGKLILPEECSYKLVQIGELNAI